MVLTFEQTTTYTYIYSKFTSRIVNNFPSPSSLNNTLTHGASSLTVLSPGREDNGLSIHVRDGVLHSRRDVEPLRVGNYMVQAVEGH